MRLNGKKAIVTGAGRGIGKGLALALAKEGADLLLHYNKSSTSAEELAREIKQLGRKAALFQADMRNTVEIRKMIQTARDILGGIDILINNAALSETHDFFEITEKEWDRIQGINLKGLFFASQEAAKQMKTQGGGKIIHIGSLHSNITLTQLTVYAASKGGVNALTRQMALELAPHNITVNTVSPGFVEVERFLENPEYEQTQRAKQIPLGRVGFPKDVAKAVVFFASSESDYITGQILAVDGGLSSQLAFKRNSSD
ncbi:MAG: SDR family NAD(P)-dependent oxidoreductase [Spirochaetia bacterium]